MQNSGGRIVVAGREAGREGICNVFQKKISGGVRSP